MRDGQAQGRRRRRASIRSIRSSIILTVQNATPAMASLSSATPTAFLIRSILPECCLRLRWLSWPLTRFMMLSEHSDFSAERLGQFQGKLDQGIESMRKLVYAFYNDGFSFAQFLRKYPEQRINIINLLIGDVFREGVDEVYGPMSEFAEIPPPLYEQVDGQPTKSDPEEVLSAKYSISRIVSSLLGSKSSLPIPVSSGAPASRFADVAAPPTHPLIKPARPGLHPVHPFNLIKSSALELSSFVDDSADACLGYYTCQSGPTGR